VEAMTRDSGIPRMLGIPREESVHTVIALGHPQEFYLRPAGRKAYLQRVFLAPTKA
jgi:hypothetical protein